jgi:hypothetical protein
LPNSASALSTTWTRIRRSPWQQIHSRNYRVSQLMYLGRITLSLFVLQTSKILRFNSTTPTASWTGSTEHVDRPMILTCRIDHIDWEFCCDSLQTQQVWLRTVRTKRHWCLTPNPLQKEEHQSRVHDLQSCFFLWRFWSCLKKVCWKVPFQESPEEICWLSVLAHSAGLTLCFEPECCELQIVCEPWKRGKAWKVLFWPAVELPAIKPSFWT